MENNANQLNSMLCKRNCGFFGNAACDGYCSKCYKDHVKRQNSGSAAGRVTPTSISHSESQQQQQQQLQQQSNTNTIANLSTESTTTSITTTASSESAQQQQHVTAPMSHPQQTSAPIAIPQKHHNHNETVSMICESAPAYTSIEPCHPSQAAIAAQQGGETPNGAAGGLTLKSVESSSSLASSNDLSTSLSTSSEKKKRTRCCVESCKRKVGLTGFDCRCGGLYCWEHRYSDKHDCKFDYKELGQDQIRKNNPIVVGEKIQKI